MIPNQLVEVFIVRKDLRDHYNSFGYETEINDEIRVPPWHLMDRSNKIVNVICDKCSAEFKRSYQKVSRRSEHFCDKCYRKESGKIISVSKIGTVREDMRGSNNNNWNPNKTEFEIYCGLVVRYTRINYNKHKHLINPDNLPRTRIGIEGGYQLDYIINMNDGFIRGISPEELSSPENLRMIQRSKPELKNEFLAYRYKVTLLTVKTYRRFKHIINPLNLPRGKSGIDGRYQVDHIISVKKGFEEGILPEIIAEKENLQMLPWRENLIKSYK